MNLEIRDSHVQDSITLISANVYEQYLMLPAAINAALVTKPDGYVRVIIRAGGATLSVCDAGRRFNMLTDVDWPLDATPGDRADLTVLDGGSVLTIDLSA